MTPNRTPISFIATADPGSAQVFYETVLGLTLVETSPFALVFDDAGHMLRIQIVPEHTPPPYTVHGWQVRDIDAEVQTLSRQGITMSTFDHLDQDEQGIWTTPDGAKIAWFTDPSGNILSLTQFHTA